jgi:hypothetical protein
LCTVLVVVVAGLLVVDVVEEELPLLPPHPAIATVAASVAASVSMAVSDVLLIGRAPLIVACCWLGRSPYQAFSASGASPQSKKRDPARRPSAGCATL